ncbi:helix-turn-helix domain-containing protein [Nocardioides dongkuii]|uniref:helix-turn-helix domain-containing protein n=1 Tax=Nocardioides dongkuii TaxID=2760089 RepID=UPI0015FB3D7B|nr:AraC family transcriptional regulator [Nocardioides dongkuii]
MRLPPPAAADWQFPRAVAGVAVLVRYAAARGVAPSLLLAGTGLRPADLDLPDRDVTAAQELRVVRTLQRILPGSGAAVGAAYRPETFGAFGYGLLASRTVLDAMELALRFIDLSFTFAIPRAEVVGEEVVVTVDGSGLPRDVRAFLVARDATAINTVLAGLVPGGVGAVLTLGEDAAELRLPVAELDRPLPTRGSPETAAAVCRDVVAPRRSRTGLVRDVQVLLTQRLPDGAPMAAVAAGLGLTERSLRRRLTAEGTGYQALLDEVRSSIACSLLGGRATIPVADVADRLGYTDPAAFVRAFRRWTGTTPGAYRAGCRFPRITGET